MYSPRDLAAFLAILETGSVSAAAASLFLSQPTLSRQIASLERVAGLRLFRRTPQGMVPTVAGRRLEPIARDLVVRSQRAERVMAGLAGSDREFTVACPQTTGNGFVAPFLAQGGPIHDVRPVAPSEVYEQLRRGADIAVGTSHPPAGLGRIHLGRLGIQCRVRADHPFAGRTSVELREVAAGQFVMPGEGSAVSRVVSQVAASAGFAIDAMLASNGTLAQARTAAGRGPSLVVEEPGFGLRGVNVEHEGKPLVVDFYGAWEPGHYASDEILEIVTNFKEFMQHQIEVLGLHLAGE